MLLVKTISRGGDVKRKFYPQINIPLDILDFLPHFTFERSCAYIFIFEGFKTSHKQAINLDGFLCNTRTLSRMRDFND